MSVVAVLAIPVNSPLKVVSGKRFLTLKAADIEHYSGSRAKRGMALPRGFQRVEGLEGELGRVRTAHLKPVTKHSELEERWITLGNTQAHQLHLVVQPFMTYH